MVEYHRAVYCTLMKQAQAIRRKKLPRPVREDRDYNSEQKFEGRRSNDESRRKKGKTRKSFSLESNETNETEDQHGEKSAKSPDKRMVEYEKEIKPECHHHHMMERSEEKREMICSVEREERSMRGSKTKCKPEPEIWMNEDDSELEYERNPEKLKEEPSNQSVSSQATFSSKNS